MPGYYFAKDKKRWVARIKIHSDMVRLGQFETEKEAALAYDYACRRVNRTDFNFPDEPIPKAIRDVVKPKLEKFKLAEKVENAIAAADQKIWTEGEHFGVEWATFCPGAAERVLAIEKEDIEGEEPSVIADMIGCGDDFDDIVTGRSRKASRQPIRSRVNQIALIRGFLIGAKRVFRAEKEERERKSKAQESLAKWLAEKNQPPAAEQPEDAPNASPSVLAADSEQAVATSRQHLSELLAELREKRKQEQVDESDDGIMDMGEQVPGTIVQPNGEVWSADCNPETLARDNQAIADARRDRTGMFAMMDEIDREREAKRRRAEELLAELL